MKPNNEVKHTEGGERSEHTPTPWSVSYLKSVSPSQPCIVGTDGEPVGGRNRKLQTWRVNAEFIVRAVNSHEALLDALITALPYVETALEDQGYKPGVVDRMVKQIRTAIALAEGKGE